MRIPPVFPLKSALGAAAVLAGLLVAGLGSVLACALQTSQEQTREEWQNVPAVVEALAVGTGSAVADIGAGGGFFTVRLARAVGREGRVYAVDVAESEVARLRRRAEDEGLAQVEVVQGTTSNPGLAEASLDAALIVNAYHEMREHRSMLKALRRALRPGGRLVIVEPIDESRRGESRRRQEGHHEIEPKFVEADLQQAGFRVVETRDPFTRTNRGKTEYLIIAER